LKNDDIVGIGRILRSQGTEGELKLRLYAKDSLKAGLSSVFVEEKEGVGEYRVESLRLDRNVPILKLEGVDNLAQADALAGRRIYAEATDFLPPGEGCVYDFQVIGSGVETVSGRSLGVVKGLIPAGSSDLLVVEGSGREYLIPFVEDICVEIDPDNRRIRIDPPEGLLELNEI
jgi:16S rRNA processing protein RimM